MKLKAFAVGLAAVVTAGAGLLPATAFAQEREIKVVCVDLGDGYWLCKEVE